MITSERAQKKMYDKNMSVYQLLVHNQVLIKNVSFRISVIMSIGQRIYNEAVDQKTLDRQVTDRYAVRHNQIAVVYITKGTFPLALKLFNKWFRLN